MTIWYQTDKGAGSCGLCSLNFRLTLCTVQLKHQSRNDDGGCPNLCSVVIECNRWCLGVEVYRNLNTLLKFDFLNETTSATTVRTRIIIIIKMSLLYYII